MGIFTPSTSSNTLINAMGSDMNKPSVWYEQGAAAMTAPPCTVLPQDVYYGQTIFYNPQQAISFLDECSQPTPLHSILERGFKKSGWEHPWTQASHQDVGQKITLRIRLQCCSIDKQINVRRFTSSAEACAKSKLGHEIAKALSVPLKAAFEKQCIPFESIVLYELRHVSTGSWQPILGVMQTHTAYNTSFCHDEVHNSCDTSAFPCVPLMC